MNDNQNTQLLGGARVKQVSATTKEDNMEHTTLKQNTLGNYANLGRHNVDSVME